MIVICSLNDSDTSKCLYPKYKRKKKNSVYILSDSLGLFTYCMSKQGSGTIMSLHGGYDFKYDTKFEKRIKYEWIVISLGSSAAKS